MYIEKKSHQNALKVKKGKKIVMKNTQEGKSDSDLKLFFVSDWSKKMYTVISSTRDKCFFFITIIH